MAEDVDSIPIFTLEAESAYPFWGMSPPTKVWQIIRTYRRRTWRGERGEEWSPAQGLESILLSIQSLMSANPYENEPGFEDANEVQDKRNQKDYVQKVVFSPWAAALEVHAHRS